MLPWSERYRPLRLDDIVGQPRATRILKAYAGTTDAPNFLFAGPSGVGKTTAARCFAREVLGDGWRLNYNDYNASDDRGIDIIREKLKPIAAQGTMGASFKLIFLDEADQMTKEAQFALRRVMEDYSKTCRFILSCNFPNRLIDAIRGRCFAIMFKPIPPEEVLAMLARICESEKVEFSKRGLTLLAEGFNGDLRSTITVLQTIATSETAVNEETVFPHIGKTPPSKVRALLRVLLADSPQDEKFDAIDNFVVDLEYDGWGWESSIAEITQQVLRSEDVPLDLKGVIVARIGEVAYWSQNVARPMLQVRSFLYWLDCKLRRAC